MRTIVCTAVLSACAFAAEVPTMNNWTVYQAVKSGTSTEAIIKAIRGSQPRFNLDPVEIEKLTTNGVSQEIIDAMSARQLGLKDQGKTQRVDRRPRTDTQGAGGTSRATLNPVQVSAVSSVIPSGTRVPCRLEQTISSATADEGQQVQLVVTEDVRAGNDVLLIPQGSPVVGTVIQSLAKRRLGRTGKLDFSIDKVRAIDGRYVPVRYSINKKEGGSHAVSTGVMTAGAAVLFWPAAPFFLLRKGKDATINKGMVFEVFTDEDHVIAAPSVASTTPAEPVVNTVAAPAIINFTADAAGADIEVDGAYVGSTPSTHKLAPGSHKVLVRNGAKVWERTVLVQADTTITVHAKVTE